MTPEQMALEYSPELQGLSREKKLAELLLGQGLQQPQGQMISGRYIAPSTAQMLNPIANILAGQAIGERADKKQTDLALALRAQEQNDLAKFSQLLQSSPAEAYAFASRSKVPQLREIGLKKMMPEEYTLAENATRIMSMPDGTSKVVAKGAEKYRAPLQVDTGTYIEYRDPTDPNKVLSRVPKQISPEAAARLNQQAREFSFNTGQPMGGVGAPQGNTQSAPQNVVSGLPTITHPDQPGKEMSPEKFKEYADKNFNGNVNEAIKYVLKNGYKIKPTSPQNAPVSSPQINALQQPNMQGQTPVFRNKAEQDIYVAAQKEKSRLQAEAQNALPGALQTAEMGLQTINGLIGDTTVDEKGNIVYGKQRPLAGFSESVGMPSLSSGFGITNLFPGSDAANFKAAFKQIEGQAFLGAIATLKGSGAISEAEGAKATAALTRMSLSQSEVEFIKAANEFKAVLQKGYTAAQQRAGVAPINPNAQPSLGNTNIPKYNAQTGKWE